MVLHLNAGEDHPSLTQRDQTTNSSDLRGVVAAACGRIALTLVAQYAGTRVSGTNAKPEDTLMRYAAFLVRRCGK